MAAPAGLERAADRALFEALRAQLAKARGLAPFMVFPDRTLYELAARARPSRGPRHHPRHRAGQARAGAKTSSKSSGRSPRPAPHPNVSAVPVTPAASEAGRGRSTPAAVGARARRDLRQGQEQARHRRKPAPVSVAGDGGPRRRSARRRRVRIASGGRGAARRAPSRAPAVRIRRQPEASRRPNGSREQRGRQRGHRDLQEQEQRDAAGLEKACAPQQEPGKRQQPGERGERRPGEDRHADGRGRRRDREQEQRQSAAAANDTMVCSRPEIASPLRTSVTEREQYAGRQPEPVAERARQRQAVREAEQDRGAAEPEHDGDHARRPTGSRSGERRQVAHTGAR